MEALPRLELGGEPWYRTDSGTSACGLAARIAGDGTTSAGEVFGCDRSAGHYPVTRHRHVTDIHDGRCIEWDHGSRAARLRGPFRTNPGAAAETYSRDWLPRARPCEQRGANDTGPVADN